MRLLEHMHIIIIVIILIILIMMTTPQMRKQKLNGRVNEKMMRDVGGKSVTQEAGK